MFLSGLRHRSNMQIPLWKRNRYFLPGKCLIDGTVEFMCHAAAINRLINPAKKFEVETRIPEFAKSHAWLGLAANLGVRDRDTG